MVDAVDSSCYRKLIWTANGLATHIDNQTVDDVPWPEFHECENIHELRVLNEGEKEWPPALYCG